jgi:hypothetical protein
MFFAKVTIMNNFNNISVVVCVYREDKFAYLKEQLLRFGCDDIVEMRQQTSIFEAYQKAWQKAKYETLYFLHEDIQIEELDETRINQFLDKDDTGFLGVAGTRYLDSSAIWWTGMNTEVQTALLSGCCGHINESKKWLSQYGAFGEVVVLDGVVLICKKSTLEKIGGFLDDGFSGFDFYDLTVTFRARLAGLKNYTVPIQLYHWGMGIQRPEWEAARKFFIEKYASHLPHSILELTT